MDMNCMVTTPYGKLIGGKAQSAYSNKEYFQFLGIPYAAPPIGKNRFLPPKPPKRWSGTLDATNERNECLQISILHSTLVGSEDCLYLNVYTTEAPRNIKTPKPVIVQIHPGGHFWGGSSKWSLGNPDFFIHHDIIFVSFNYRLHVLGFLNLDLHQCSGNMGLKDQNFALKWVKENISYFGGDPDNITIHGTSSGASDLHLHMMSPMSKDLFHRGIMKCGYVLNPCWTYQNNHLERALELAKMMGFTGKSNTELLRFFKRQDAMALLDAHERLKRILIAKNEEKGEVCLFQPSIEAFEENAFLSKSPRELIKTMIPKPLICSISAEEGLVSFWIDPIKMIERDFKNVIRENMWQYKIEEDMLQTICKEIRSFYFNDKSVDDTMSQEVLDMYSDMWYCEWQDWLDSISTNPSEAPIYLFYFSHIGRLNYQQRHFSKFLPKNSPKIGRASHADDGSYFFLLRVLENLKLPLKIAESDAKIVEYMTLLITNFAKNGDPNDEKLSKIHWTPHTAENPSYLHFDEDVEVVHGKIFEKRAAFWRDLIKRVKEREKELYKVNSDS